MRMRDWELIANVHGDRWRELKWIEDYFVEVGCDRRFLQRILAFPDFQFSKFGEYISVLFDEVSEGDKDWLADNVIMMQEAIMPCAEEYFELLNSRMVKLINALAILNWWILVRWKLRYTLWSKDNKEEDRAWRAGQVMLSYWKLNRENYPSQQVWSVYTSWTIPSWRSFALGITIGGIENLITFHVGLLLVRVFFQIEKLPNYLARWFPEKARELSFTIHHSAIWINLFSDPDEWRSGDWRRIVIHPINLLFGTEHCEKVLVGERSIEIYLDNRVYFAIATQEIRTWVRTRFPFLKKTRRDVGLNIENGIPVPGKGENSYDCGEDAIYSTGASTSDLTRSWDDLTQEAIANLLESVRRTRLRYGGANWKSFVQQVADDTGLDVIKD